MSPPTHSTASQAATAPDGAEPVGAAPLYAVRSIGVALKARRLERFLEGRVRFAFLPPGISPSRSMAGLAGWGAKGTARAEAARRGLPYLALEDGFLRTAGLGGRGDRAMSLTADFTGVNYDASRPSDLEALIGDWTTLTPGELEDARRLMQVMRDAGLGKFNAAPDVDPDDPLLHKGRLVLVVDQIAGDQSIAGGGCSAATFEEMLDAAIAENADATVVARVHPYDGKGARRGHLKDLAAARGLPVFSADVSWMSLARHAERVYVATSHAGLEALIAGARVTCFGLPAYAGWGLTDDRATCPRRTARPTLEALVAAVYLRYTRYLSPLDDQPCPALHVANLLAERRRRDAETAGATHVLGVNRLKRVQIRPFVQGRRSTVTWSLDADRALDQQRRLGGRVAVWASREPPDLAERCAVQGAPLIRIEDGFLRSVGLGANLALPSSLVLDPDGIYYDPAQPSGLERLLQTTAFDEDLLQRASALRAEIGAARLSKYNVGAGSLAEGWSRAVDRKRVLVPAQVADDASVVRGGGAVRDNLGLLQAVRASTPDAFIVYKPHPDVEAGLRSGALPDAEVLRYADAIAHRASIAALLDEVEEVHTLTSLSGFEALLRGRKVVTYGLPFYAGWGLTQDRERCARRTRILTLDELIACSLVLYPRYTDRVSGWPCGPEQVIQRLNEGLIRSNNVDLLGRRRGRAVLRQLLD